MANASQPAANAWPAWPYAGLVIEVGVGLIPRGGGLAYGARRAAEESRSAIEAQSMGYLLEDDRIVLNAHELLHTAVREARAMHDAGWRAPRRSSFRVMWRAGIATIAAQLVNMRDGGFISAHDFHLGRTIAEVMCDGDVDAASMVDETCLMGRERKAFMGLLEHPKTQERIMGMKQTGKPVRN